jgi:HD superfamily phosphohydrolase YqeK
LPMKCLQGTTSIEGKGRSARIQISEWMVHEMDAGFERELKKTVKTYLDRGRSGDYEHTLRAVGYGKKLLRHEEGEEAIVIPALYLHDVGWGEVNFEDFINIASPSQRKDAASVNLHMKRGATLAKQILEELGYDREMTRAIVSIIAVHDRPQKILAMENPSATLVLEADYLDRFGAKSLSRFERMFEMKPVTEIEKKDAAAYLKKGLKTWFRTRTARRMALQLAKESGLC